MDDLSSNNFSSKKKTVFVFGAVAFILLLYFIFFNVPSDFPVGSIVGIESGMNLRSVSLQLKNAHIINSRTIFEAFMILYGGERHLVSSDYLLDHRLPAFEIARRMERGESHLAPVKVVIPEGFNDSQIADVFTSRLVTFNKSKFLVEAQEGYLFPDTYFFLTRANEVDALKLMTDNFNKKLKSLLPEISLSGKSEKDIITMASIIEREAKGNINSERNIISGILWKRLSLGMSLQVDSAPETYKVKGLPKNPICNPGLESIQAALHPKSSVYLYYLHDKMGNIHYAKNFTEHQANILKYLK